MSRQCLDLIIMKTNAGGGIGGIFGRAFTGESIFQNIYTSKSDDGMIAFASSFPGEIRDFLIRPDHSIILQKTAFLAGETSINLSVHFQKKIGSGLFGGEGLFNTKLTGPGKVWLQTMPLSKVAQGIIPFIPRTNNN